MPAAGQCSQPGKTGSMAANPQKTDAQWICAKLLARIDRPDAGRSRSCHASPHYMLCRGAAIDRSVYSKAGSAKSIVCLNANVSRKENCRRPRYAPCVRATHRAHAPARLVASRCAPRTKKPAGAGRFIRVPESGLRSVPEPRPKPLAAPDSRFAAKECSPAANPGPAAAAPSAGAPVPLRACRCRLGSLPRNARAARCLPSAPPPIYFPIRGPYLHSTRGCSAMHPAKWQLSLMETESSSLPRARRTNAGLADFIFWH